VATPIVSPTIERAAVEKLFPAIARWVRGYGHIEVGDQEDFGFIIRVLDFGGVVYEDNRPRTLAEAMAVLDTGHWSDGSLTGRAWTRTGFLLAASTKRFFRLRGLISGRYGLCFSVT